MASLGKKEEQFAYLTKNYLAQDILMAMKAKFLFERDLLQKLSDLKISLSAEALAELEEIEMAKISDELTFSNFLSPKLTEEIKDPFKTVTEAAEKILNGRGKPFHLSDIDKIVLIDIRWLLKLSEHYKCTETDEWKLFCKQQLVQASSSSLDAYDSLVKLSQKD